MPDENVVSSGLPETLAEILARDETGPVLPEDPDLPEEVEEIWQFLHVLWPEHRQKSVWARLTREEKDTVLVLYRMQ